MPDEDWHADMEIRARLLLALASVCTVPSATAQDAPDYVRNVVVVQFAPDVAIANKASASGLQEFDRRAALYGVHLIERVYPFLDHVEPTPKTRRNLMALRRTYYVRYHAAAAPRLVAKQLDGVPGVVYAEPVLVNRTQALSTWERVDPDDPTFGEQTYLRHMRLPEAWDVVKSDSGSPRVVIAIVDLGGEWHHEDLVGNVWTNPKEIPDNGVDDDNNGFIDDVHGANFRIGDPSNNDPVPHPGTHHGTLVAGSASAVTDNGVGVVGAAWNADIMHVSGSYGGILYAAANGADIINASWGSWSGTDTGVRMIDETLNLATDMGALVVAAAGNNNFSDDLYRFYPAQSPRVLSVGATEKDSRRRARFSNYGKLVNVFAPGMGILSTANGNSYRSVEGTSLASPLVAGVAALVKTRFPEIEPDALREHIRLTSDNMDAENPGLAGQLGSGFVNALAGVRAPALPAVRLNRWSWADSNGDRQIESGSAVTIKASMVNYLSDAHGLSVGLVAAESYSFIDITEAEVDVGFLAGGDSVEVRLGFTVAADAPANQRVLFYTRISSGAFEDSADMLSFRVNRSLEAVHRSLSALYSATDGNNWRNNRNWDISTIPSEEMLAAWHGIHLIGGFLVGLHLPRNNLTGNLPSELGRLPYLRRLEISQNMLSGPMPSELGSLRHLRLLHMFDNSLTGPIPPELGNLSQLEELDLRSNSLTGPVPPEFGNLSRLEHLKLDRNSLTGPIPPELGSLQRMLWLTLSENSLNGQIPPELGNLSQLEVLNLQDNALSGSIPIELGSLSRLKRLRVDYNTLTGMLPRSFIQLESLEEFSFGGQDLCAPEDNEFQAWLSSIPDVDGPTCGAVRFTERIAGQTFTAGSVISPLVLPEASGGVQPYVYALEPALPAGLAFDHSARTICGLPSEAAPAASFVYSAVDGGGSSAGFSFTIEVAPAVAFQGGVQDQSYPRTTPIATLLLPEASGGVPPISYALTTTLPEGLAFDAPARTISGVPTEVTAAPVPVIYWATDTNGSADSLAFSMEVFSPVAIEGQTLPHSFTAPGNYPNPFRESTRLVIDLPWPARVAVEVMDIAGRRVLTLPAETMPAGWGRSVELNAMALSSGPYLYRLVARSETGTASSSGRMLLLR